MLPFFTYLKTVFLITPLLLFHFCFYKVPNQITCYSINSCLTSLPPCLCYDFVLITSVFKNIGCIFLQRMQISCFLTIFQECRYLYVCVHGQSCPILCDPMDYSPPGFSAMGFPRQEYWNGLPCSPPGDLPDQGSDLLLCIAESLSTEPPHRHIFILFKILFLYRLSQNFEQSSLCYPVGPCQLSILYI